MVAFLLGRKLVFPGRRASLGARRKKICGGRLTSSFRDVVDATYVIKLIPVVSVFTAVFLVLADLQTMTDTLNLPSCHEHLQHGVCGDIEQLRGRDASLRCIKRECSHNPAVVLLQDCRVKNSAREQVHAQLRKEWPQ